MRPRIGSLCSGYGGLDMAVEEFYGATTAWHCEYEAAPSKILAAHWDVPNHHDLTKTDWSTVEPVDMVTAGWPCQPWSAAGAQKGTADARAIWPSVANAIRRLRPGVVVLENVPAIVVLGELARAVGDLAALGYDAQWQCVRASDVGAPHKRERCFIVATNTADDRFERSGFAWTGRDGSEDRRNVTANPNGLAVRQQPIAIPQRHGEGLPGQSGAEAVSNTASDGRNEGWPESTGQLGRHDAAECGGSPIADASRGGRERRREVQLARTSGDLAGDGAAAADPNRGERDGREQDQEWITFRRATPARRRSVDWGDYAPAIERWAPVVGRPAPNPTEPGRNGQRLSPLLVEWMMGLPKGWVTDVDITRNEQLKALGNGVVPQQALAALAVMSSYTREESA